MVIGSSQECNEQSSCFYTVCMGLGNYTQCRAPARVFFLGGRGWLGGVGRVHFRDGVKMSVEKTYIMLNENDSVCVITRI